MFVSEFSVWVTSAYERYDLIKKLQEKSNDPPNEPYRSKYEAREILNQLATEIEKKWTSYGYMQVKLLYSLFNFEIALISLKTDEITAGCDALNTSWEFIKDVANAPEGCYLALRILNQLAIIWSERGENGKALDYLLQAEGIYNNYKSTHEICPLNFEDMFVLENVEHRDWKLFEKTYTLTLYYMAQVYELEEQNEKSASCCRETLKRQRESGDYEIAEWGLNCATLSQYYLKEKMFEEARHLLCCAIDATLRRENELNAEEIDDEKDVWGELHLAKASVACCMIKYCCAVIQESYYDLRTNGEDHSRQIPRDIVRLTCDKNVASMEEKIPVHVSCYDEAKNHFLLAVSYITEAKQHYTLNQYANNHVQIVQDHSTLYKCLAYFESDLSRQCKMFKRRIDMLEDVLRKLNPQYYLSVCRQLQFELGEIYFEMMDNKLKIAQACSDSLNSSAVKKINSLVTQGITHFSDFIKSFQDKDGKNPDAFSEDNVRPALIAYFYLGRFYSKLIESDTNRKLHNLTKSEECYKIIVKYVEKNPNHICYIEKELPIAKEMIELMPERISQVTGSTLF